MEKTKLLNARITKGLSQAKIAEDLGMNVSNYNRKEKGQVKIYPEEWQKLAKLLDMPLEDIYEPDDKMVFICKDQSIGINNGTNHIYTVPEFMLESQRKYIAMLEAEIERMKVK
jgi:DNA-binding XRE family transcriptional regulator